MIILQSPFPTGGDPSLLLPYAWYKGDGVLWQNSARTTPATALSDPIGAADDVSGNNRHILQATAGKRCVFDSGKKLILSQMPNDNYFTAPASFVLARRNFSVFIIAELSNLREPMNGSSVSIVHDYMEASDSSLILWQDNFSAKPGRLGAYDGTARESTTEPLTTGLCLLGWVGTAGNLTCWLDGVSTTATALTNGNSTIGSIMGAVNSVNPSQAGFKDYIVFNRAITAGEVADVLLPYAYSRGVPNSRSGQIIFEGDSITHGYGSTLNRNWPSRLTLSTSIRRRNMALSGLDLLVAATEGATQIDQFLIAGEMNVLTVFLGTNDIALTGASGATTYTRLTNYCTARAAAATSAGKTLKIIVVTPLPRGTGAIGGQYAIYRNAILADHSFADAMVDPLGDATFAAAWGNGTYDFDDIHPNDNGYAFIAGLMQTAIAAFF